ncbi:hypothetical protein GUITHDRAFT_156329 [Guillardia theta CCMP2712]|uniref:mitogen-activated protein kinase kinase n=1 Tax=Guillardia theta (strain CCMP2712) TaxID=905079 RepID=L1I888_GUITC|nr:hypothetical protein GUITHDRAFT_156329 [Guillardia theta CCMP2712]EKX32443.1 hypothetical protein GUITHDRAFT_156329 [Guillardia theta CCMP2712]|eukprot:XP_005819423.1 hypothetical protein GUITHDRAFT_156329 [Guillardia theta CCMP2712]
MPKKPTVGLAVGSEAGCEGILGGGARSNTFDITASGTFNLDDFKVKSTGIQQTPAGSGPISTLQMSDLQLDDKALGEGASGTVRRALHLPTQRQIALKAINVNDKGKCEQMITELKTLLGAQSRGVCPNLVEFYDAFWSDPVMYIAMELMDAGSLDAALKRCPKPTEEVVSIITRQILQGLHFLHKERHNIHRDLKPGNVLLHSSGVVKLADFGISRAMDNTMAQAETFTGTAIYMSPERMQGKRYSFPADVWAVGLIATECVLGKYPYNVRPDMKYFDLVLTILNQNPPSPGPEYSAEFNEFVAICLHKQEQSRGTCEQLLQHPFILRYAQSPETVVAEWLSGEKMQS